MAFPGQNPHSSHPELGGRKALGHGLVLKSLPAILEAGAPVATMELPVNPATPSAQNPGQQPASCRPAVGVRKASNQESQQ